MVANSSFLSPISILQCFLGKVYLLESSEGFMSKWAPTSPFSHTHTPKALLPSCLGRQRFYPPRHSALQFWIQSLLLPFSLSIRSLNFIVCTSKKRFSNLAFPFHLNCYSLIQNLPIFYLKSLDTVLIDLLTLSPFPHQQHISQIKHSSTLKPLMVLLHLR